MGRSVYHESFVNRVILEACASRAWMPLMNASKNLKDLLTLDKHDALMAKEDEVVAGEPVVTAGFTVDSDALLDVSEDDDGEFEGVAGLDEVELVRVNRKVRESQVKCCAKRRKVLTTVAYRFTLANELFGSVNVHMSMA